MSNFTTASTIFAALVLAAATALAIIIWRASERLGERRLRFIAGGFAVLALKSAVSILSIQHTIAHHEVTEAIGTAFDVAMISLMAAPLWVKE
ncbi:MAG: hypothetical protein ACPHID_01840 [Thermoplasmatota archaeon]